MCRKSERNIGLGKCTQTYKWSPRQTQAGGAAAGNMSKVGGAAVGNTSAKVLTNTSKVVGSGLKGLGEENNTAVQDV